MEEAFGVLTFPFPLSLADQINRAGTESKARGKPARTNLIIVKPAVGFTLPSAGVTPAPSEEIAKCRGRPFALRFWGKAPVCNYLARSFTAGAAGRIAPVSGRVRASRSPPATCLPDHVSKIETR